MENREQSLNSLRSVMGLTVGPTQPPRAGSGTGSTWAAKVESCFAEGLGSPVIRIKVRNSAAYQPEALARALRGASGWCFFKKNNTRSEAVDEVLTADGAEFPLREETGDG